MVLRRPAAPGHRALPKAKAKAAASAAATPKCKAKAKAKAQAEPLPRATWCFKRCVVVYISKLIKCDATFIVFLPEGSVMVKKIFMDGSFLNRFCVYEQELVHSP